MGQGAATTREPRADADEGCLRADGAARGDAAGVGGDSDIFFMHI